MLGTRHGFHARRVLHKTLMLIEPLVFQFCQDNTQFCSIGNTPQAVEVECDWFLRIDSNANNEHNP